MQMVTDPTILAQLNKTATNSMPNTAVTDPAILAQLNKTQPVPSQDGTKLSQTAVPTKTINPSSSNSQPNLLQDVANSPLISKINALGGGAQQTLANSIGYAGGLIGDLTGQKAITNISQKAAQVLQPPGFIQDTMKNNPKTTLAGNVMGEIVSMGDVGIAAGAVLPETAAAYAANAIIGSATAGQGLTNRALGATSGLVLNKVANVVGNTASKIVSNLSLPQKMKDFVATKVNNVFKGETSDEAAQGSITNMWNIATKMRDQLYNDFKLTPGLVNTKPLANQAVQITQELADVMTPGQKGVFKTIATQAQSVKNLNDLHELTKSITDMKALFLKSGTAPDVAQSFKTIKQVAQDTLTSNAENLGVLDKLQLAQKFNKQVIVPLQEFGSDKIAAGDVSTDGFLAKFIKSPTTQRPEGSPQALGNLLNAMDSNGREVVTGSLLQRISKSIQTGADGLTPQKGVKMAQDYIDLYGDKIGPDAVNTLKGMQKMLTEATQLQSSASKLAFGSGIAGPLIHPIAFTMSVAQHLLSNETTRVALTWAGEHKSGAVLLKQIMTNYISAYAGSAEQKLSK